MDIRGNKKRENVLMCDIKKKIMFYFIEMRHGVLEHNDEWY